jgi:hypothetical protein
MKGWHGLALAVVFIAIGRWLIPRGWPYTVLWLLAMLAIWLALRRWSHRTDGTGHGA